MVKRSIEQEIRNKNSGNRSGNFEKNAVVKNQGTKQRGQRILGDCWQWKANGQCSKGDNCSFRHDNQEGCKNDTAESFSELFYAAEWGKCIENQKSQRQESQWKNVSIALQRLHQRNLHQFVLWEMASSRMFFSTSPRVDADWGKSALMHTARLMNSPAKGLKRMVTQVQSLCWKVHDNWVSYFMRWSRRNLHRFCGRAQAYGNRSDV